MIYRMSDCEVVGLVLAVVGILLFAIGTSLFLVLPSCRGRWIV